MRTPSRTRTLGLLAGVLVAAFLFHYRPIQDDDAWLHFAAGRWIFEHGAIPRVDSFSCTAPGVLYVDHEWFAQVLFEGTRRGLGLPGFRALAAGCAAAAFVIFTVSALRLGASDRAAGLAALGSLALQWHVARPRPQVFTLLCVAILLDRFILRPGTPAGRWPVSVRRTAGLFGLMVFWANVHAAAVIAPGLLGLAAAGAWLYGDRSRCGELAACAALSAVFLLANPWGMQIYQYAFETQGLANLIPEWKPILSLVFDPAELARVTGGSDFRTQAIYLGLLAICTVPLAVVALWARRNGDGVSASLAAWAPPAAACSILPFVANRHDLFIMIPATFAATCASQRVRERPGLRRPAQAVAWFAAALAAAAVLRDADYRHTYYKNAGVGMFSDVFPAHEPFAAVEFIKTTGLEGNCFNRPSWGGYLLFETYPAVRVSFDGRITTLGADIYRDHVDFFNGRRCAEIAEKYQIDFAVVLPFLFGLGKPPDQPGYVAPDLSRDWVVVYRDSAPDREGSAVVALRRASPRFEQNLSRVRAAGR
jgi:hypothetical protein